MASLVRSLIEFGVAAGHSRDDLLSAVGSSELDGERRLPRAAYTDLWAQIAGGACGQGPSTSLRAGLAFALQHHCPSTYGVVALRDMTAATVRDFLARHCRHHRLIDEDVSALMLETISSATLFLATASGRLGEAAAEAAIATFVVQIRSFTGADADPEEVRFEHARPEDTSAYDELFRCPVHFGQSVTSIRFSRAVLDLPLRKAQREVCEYLECRAEAAMARLGSQDLVQIVYKTVSERLSADVSIATIARSLGLGARTLQRRLKDQGVCYQDLVDLVRHHRALERLHGSEQLALISEHLGFSDPRAFRRAFARWTGVSPERYRRARAA